MATKQIGQITLEGTKAELDALTPFTKKAVDLLSHRIDAFNLKVVARADMPIAGQTKDGKIIRAEGHWSLRLRLMRLADDLFDRQLLLDKTEGHEFVHVLQSDWFGRWHRRKLLPFLTPPADNWNDLTIGDNYLGYIADPIEGFACWDSAALFGWEKPAYSTLYERKIRATDFAAVKEISLATAP